MNIYCSVHKKTLHQNFPYSEESWSSDYYYYGCVFLIYARICWGRREKLSRQFSQNCWKWTATNFSHPGREKRKVVPQKVCAFSLGHFARLFSPVASSTKLPSVREVPSKYPLHAVICTAVTEASRKCIAEEGQSFQKSICPECTQVSSRPNLFWTCSTYHQINWEMSISHAKLHVNHSEALRIFP